MSETTVEKTKKKSWFKGLKAEFKKIIWPDKKTLVKETVSFHAPEATTIVSPTS